MDRTLTPTALRALAKFFLGASKEGGLIRELCSNSKPTRAQFLASHPHF